MEIQKEVLWERSHVQLVESIMSHEDGDLSMDILHLVNNAHNALSDHLYEETEEDRYNRDILHGVELHNTYVDLYTKYYTKHLNDFIDDNDNEEYTRGVAEECGTDFPVNFYLRVDVLHTALDRIAYNDATIVLIARNSMTNS